MSVQDSLLEQLLAAYEVESAEHVQAISDGLLQLEKCAQPGQAPPILERIFREVHSLKGAARAVNFADVETICQAIENVFAAWKRQGDVPGANAFDVAHQAVDLVSRMPTARASGEQVGFREQIAAVLWRLEQLQQPQDLAVLEPATIAPPREPLAESVPAPAADGPAAGSGGTPASSMEERMPAPAADRPAAADTVRIATAKLEALLRQSEEMLALKLISAERLNELQQLRDVWVQWEKQWHRLQPDFRCVVQLLAKQTPSPASSPGPALAARLTEFLDGNHVAIRAITEHVGNIIRAAEHGRRTLGGMVDHLLEDAKKLLMLPFSSVLAMFPKLVRDLCRTEGKQAELVIRGEDVEIDKRVLEEMKDPLIHLVRNCIDHGLERPDVRTKNGKPAQGTLHLCISQIEGNKVEVLVRDDGQGIDSARVRAAAVEHGLLSEAKAAQLTDREAIALIFKSGVSTSAALTEISGRGLGLAIVREKVERMGGSIAVETQPGRGTEFRLLLPLTLATFRGISIRVADQVFVIPTADVERVLRVPRRAAIKTVECHSTIMAGGRVLPLVRLDQLLGLPPPSRARAAAEYESAVVVGAEDQRIALLVDEVLQEREVLVKGLGRMLARVRNVAGATVLGSGKPVVILNVADLLKSASQGAVAAEPALPAAETQRKEHSLLVVEDSITARILLKNILESAGYTVTTAVDGVEAWTALKTEPFDLVVSDIQMPRMNGFDLTAKIRADQSLARLPVILVTGLASREDRERGVDVGANAYIVKRDFDQSNLLEVIERLI